MLKVADVGKSEGFLKMPQLSWPDTVDLAFLRCTATATSGERLELEMFDVLDEATGFTAMERTTAYSATACLVGVPAGKVAIGADFAGPTPTVGDRVRIFPNHSCLVTALHDPIYVVQGHRVVDQWRPVRGW